MTTLATVLTGPQSVYTSATVPSMGTMNSYNASAGALSVTLPALSGLNVGASCVVEKYQLDGTFNTVTFTVAGTDTFDDTTTSIVLFAPGEKISLQVITVGGTKYWKRELSSNFPNRGGISSLATAFSLTNSTTKTAIISGALPAGFLAAGSTFRVKLIGTIQVAATSGTLTFTPYLQNTALAQTAVMPSQTSAAGPVSFSFEYLISVRTTGSSGTAIAQPWGTINFATPVYLASISTAATTVNTTTSAASNLLQVSAQWATASTSNILTVQTGILERVL